MEWQDDPIYRDEDGGPEALPPMPVVYEEDVETEAEEQCLQCESPSDWEAEIERLEALPLSLRANALWHLAHWQLYLCS